MKRVAKVVLLALAAVFAVGTIRMFRLQSRQPAPSAPASITIDLAAAATRLSGALQFPTISWGDAARRDGDAFLGLHTYLQDKFPAVGRVLTREAIATYSLLYTWPGRRGDLPPVILVAHLDVVPAETSGRAWTQPPFSGAIADGKVWGRGAIDDKSGVLGLLESVEALIGAGFTPERTIYLAFGHNEEDGGDASGAAAIARHLAGRGVHDAFLLDEGGVIFDRVPGVRQPVAFVGITEKDPVTFELRVTAPGGHASMPPTHTAVGILGRALDRLEQRPMPSRLDGAARETFMTLAPEMTPPMRAVFANLWLTRPAVLRRFAQTPETNATIRTTMAPTMLEASPKANVLATAARAIVNVRLLPGDRVPDAQRHMRAAIDDPRVEIVVLAGGGGDPPPISSATSADFARLGGAIRSVYPEVLVAPFLTVAATDSRHYVRIAPHIYRFLPIHFDGAFEAVHGVDEHVTIDAYEKAIRVYATIIKEMAGR
ncbi:MAG TPA: M20 family peptidase [Vicinamibacterales bacterium]|nr:M20 family peptidase [Vicinamibacterales bacterium]